MKQAMKWKQYFIGVILVVFLLALPSGKVSADMGPKPSVTIDFAGIGEQPYWVTLLAKEESTGPFYVDHEFSGFYEEKDRVIWEKFKNYEDGDGFHFLGYFEECTGQHQFEWGYYPPQTFKILLYFPETDSFLVSPKSYQQYAFHSYYTMTVQDKKEDVQSGKDITVRKNYDATWELISLGCRVLATILVEILIALLWGYRKKKQLLIIGVTNIVTQTVLNIGLNLNHYYHGTYGHIGYYIGMELLVVLIEGIIYAACLAEKTENGRKGTRRLWLYALVANVASFVIGLIIAQCIPQFF